MAIVSVTIADMSGKKFKAQLPDDTAVSRLIPPLITKLNLPLVNNMGRRLSYRLVHQESGAQLRDTDTLNQANVENGHTIKLIADFVAGRK